MKILLLEDDLELCSSIQDELLKAGYIVDCCHDGETAMIHALNIEYSYDLERVLKIIPAICTPHFKLLGLLMSKMMRRIYPKFNQHK